MATFTCPHCRTPLTVTGPDPQPEPLPPLIKLLWPLLNAEPSTQRTARGWAETLHPDIVVRRSLQERVRRALDRLASDGLIHRVQDDSSPFLRRAPMLYSVAG